MLKQRQTGFKFDMLFAGIILLILIVVFANQALRARNIQLDAPLRSLQSTTTGLLDKSIETSTSSFNADLRNMHERELRKEIIELRRQVISLDQLILENKRLSNLIHLKPPYSWKPIFARVNALSFEGQLTGGVLEVNTNNLKKYAPIVDEHGLAGHITSASIGSANFITITHPQFACAVMIKGDKGFYQGVVHGNGSALLDLKYIYADKKVIEGSKVYTSGLDVDVPPGIEVGIITNIQKEKANQFLTIDVQPSADLDKLKYFVVYVK